jgi:hypothetical protein
VLLHCGHAVRAELNSKQNAGPFTGCGMPRHPKLDLSGKNIHGEKDQRERATAPRCQDENDFICAFASLRLCVEIIA